MKTWRLRRDPKTLDEIRSQPLSIEIKYCIEQLAESFPTETNWLTIKKSLILMLSPGDRQLFSTREAVTKKHFPFNQFEKSIRSFWNELTGVVLLMPDDKKMEDAGPDGYL